MSRFMEKMTCDGTEPGARRSCTHLSCRDVLRKDANAAARLAFGSKPILIFETESAAGQDPLEQFVQALKHGAGIIQQSGGYSGVVK